MHKYEIWYQPRMDDPVAMWGFETLEQALQQMSYVKQKNPKAIIQGFSDDLDSTYYGAMYMAESMNQRAIGWFDSKSGGDSYARVMEDPLAYINPDA